MQQEVQGGVKGGRGMPNTRRRRHNTRPYCNQQGETDYGCYGSNIRENASFDNHDNINIPALVSYVQKLSSFRYFKYENTKECSVRIKFGV